MTLFKPSRNSNVFWTFPEPVIEILGQQLLQHATDLENTIISRANAAYEYGVVVFNANNPSETEIDTALGLLTFAAQNGHMEAQTSVGRLSDVFGRTLAVSRDEELKWLLVASRAGSTTAQQRFRDLDIDGFMAAMSDIPYGIGTTCPLLNQSLLINCYQVRQAGSYTDVVLSKLHESAITGNVGLLVEIPAELPSDWYECENAFGETPLIVACRGGHTSVLDVLLTRGANAAHTTTQGVTALHFLAAFNDNDIPRVGSILLQHGVEIDGMCERGTIYKELPDSTFGQVGGTPLLWAVAAGNHCAVQALLAHGADPFAEERQLSMFFEHTFEESPISWAARLHQTDLLKTIINKFASDSCRRFIDECHRIHNRGSLRLFRAMDCHPGLRIRDYILHGRQYECAASSCVGSLFDAGVDPILLTRHFWLSKHSQLAHPIMGACLSKNIVTLRYLWDYQNGTLRPTPRLWAIALRRAVFEGHKAGFDFLIDRRDDIPADVSCDVAVIKRILSQTKDLYFTIGVLRLVQKFRVVLSPTDSHSIFQTAVIQGHFEVAKQFWETHNINLARRTGGNTLLHHFISISRGYSDMESKISFVLTLCNHKDPLFWNIGYLDGSGLTALQFAAQMPTQKRLASPRVFYTILKYFSEPKYLNVRFGGHSSSEWAGYTALHFAVRSGNLSAVECLVQQPEIKTSVQSHRGETPMDLCVDIAQYHATDKRRGFWASKDGWNRSAVNMAIFDLLLIKESEGLIKKYSTLLLRKAWDEYTLVDDVKGIRYGIKLQGIW
ncbi:ankyrin [Colletotrichum zoysiae]|uniref:Ankyrin n=1 Tax=Colletotrichum zoysiae TaxID=1216348 RepID=A0AAD9M7W9_9PEZI|nr:ankyrin [Colletotrichum zoysiae]